MVRKEDEILEYFEERFLYNLQIYCHRDIGRDVLKMIL